MLVNSDFLNGLRVADAKRKIIDWLEEKGLGTKKINYKLRELGIQSPKVLGRADTRGTLPTLRHRPSAGESAAHFIA